MHKAFIIERWSVECINAKEFEHVCLKVHLIFSFPV